MQKDEKAKLEDFDRRIAQLHMRGQWKADQYLIQTTGGPKPAGTACLWKWTDVFPLLQEACQALPESFTARRHLGLMNPGLERGGATHTIRMGPQIALPGEVAWAHRHSIAALRFVVKGSQRAFTVVNGQVCTMNDYDLILTPAWSWHDHHNESAEPIVWMDVLDASLISMLNATFYEPYHADRQPVTRSFEREDLLATGTGGLRSTGEQPPGERLPLHYPWSNTAKLLEQFKDLRGSPYDGVSLEYMNPVTGGPALPTLGCWMQLLQPGESTEQHRHISSSVYFVVQGDGESIVDDQRLIWTRHDAFVVPNWSWHRHINRSKTTSAILFSVNDIPVYKALGLYREEPESSLDRVNALLTPARPSADAFGNKCD